MHPAFSAVILVHTFAALAALALGAAMFFAAKVWGSLDQSLHAQASPRAG